MVAQDAVVTSGKIVVDTLVAAQFIAPVEDAVVGADLCVRPAEHALDDAAPTPGGLVTHLGPPMVARKAMAGHLLAR